MSKTNRNESRLILHTSILLIVFIVFGIAMYFIRFEIEKLSREANETQNRIQADRKNTAALSELKKDEATARSMEANLLTRLPDKGGSVNFRASLVDLAQEKGVIATIKAVEPEVPRTGGNLGSIGIAATLTGSYDGIVAFFNDVYTKKYFVHFQSIDIVRQEDGYRANVNGTMFLK